MLQRAFTLRWDRSSRHPVPQQQEVPPYIASLEDPVETFRNITAWLGRQ